MEMFLNHTKIIKDTMDVQSSKKKMLSLSSIVHALLVSNAENCSVILPNESFAKATACAAA